MRFAFVGAFDTSYPRNSVIRRGLGLLGDSAVICTASRSLKAWARYPALLAKAASALRPKPDVLLVPEFCQKDVPLARLLSLALRRPLVFDPLAARYETKILDRRRGRPGTLPAWWNFRIDGLAFRLSHLVLADTAAHGRYYQRAYGLDPGKTAVLPIGYDDSLFDPSLYPAPSAAPPASPSGRDFTVLFFGSFLPLHGVQAVVEAAALVARRDPSVRFRLVGSGQTFEASRVLAARLGLRRVEFAGRLPLRRIPAEIAAADLCLGIFGRGKAGRVVPHKIFQAAGMGKPIVTARTPAVEEFFSHGETIYLCDEPYPESLAAAVLALRHDEVLRTALSTSALGLARSAFTPRAVASTLKTILEERLGLR